MKPTREDLEHLLGVARQRLVNQRSLNEANTSNLVDLRRRVSEVQATINLGTQTARADELEVRLLEEQLRVMKLEKELAAARLRLADAEVEGF